MRGRRLSRAAIFQRDNHTCVYCQRKVSMTAKPPHWMAATIDHAIPRSKSGENSDENLVTAHYGCNSRKQDLLPLDYFWTRVCPACRGPLEQRKLKLQCVRCHRIVETCCE